MDFIARHLRNKIRRFLIVVAIAGFFLIDLQELEDSRPYVMRMATRAGLSHEDAEDVTQETMIKAWTKAKLFRGDSKLRTWVCAIARNEIFMFFRKQARIAPLVSFDAEFEFDRDNDFKNVVLATKDTNLERTCERVVVARAIAELHPRRRVIFEAHFLDGYQAKEIAEGFGRTALSVKTALCRAMSDVREMVL